MCVREHCIRMARSHYILVFAKQEYSAKRMKQVKLKNTFVPARLIDGNRVMYHAGRRKLKVSLECVKSPSC